MEPRRKTNKKVRSTSLPAEYVKSIKDVLKKAFQKKLGKREIFVEGRMFPEELILCVGYVPDAAGLRQINFEASIDHKTKDLVDKMGVCLDAISSMMDQHLDDEDMELPIEWTEYDFEKKKVFLRSTSRNTNLENEANKILGVDPNDALYIEGEDALDKIDADLAKPEEDLEYEKTIEKVNEKLRQKNPNKKH
jgi:hypothetical protein